jgi:hypothetical protein
VLKYSIDNLNFSVRDSLKFLVALRRIQAFLNKMDIQQANVERNQRGNKSLKLNKVKTIKALNLM